MPDSDTTPEMGEDIEFDALPPFDSPENEDQVVDLRHLRKRREAKSRRKKISNARSTLLFVTAIFSIFCLIYLLLGIMQQSFDAYIQAAVILIHALVSLGLYIWARRQPYPALLTALVIFVGLWVLSLAAGLLMHSGHIYNGIVMRVVIVFFLTRGVLNAKSLRESQH